MPTSKKSHVRFRERAELLDFMLEVSAITAETLDLDQLLDSLAAVVSQVVPHELFAILLYSERKNGLRIRYARGHREEIVQNLLIPLGEGLTGAAGLAQQPVLVGNVLEDNRYLNTLDAVRSELAVPMVLRNKLVGVMDLQSTTLDAFSQQDKALLQLIASRVGAAIENARLYRRVERQTRIQRTLALLAQEFASILNLDALLEKIAKSVKTLINYDGFMILLVDEQQKLLTTRFSVRFDERTQMDALPLDCGITGAAAGSRRPVLARDAKADKRYVEVHEGIQSEVAIPLIVKDRVIGVMDLESERLGYFSEDHVRMLSLIAPQIATSIENARLYQELELREREVQRDLEAARKLQSVILPTAAPSVEGLDIGVLLKPARQVTGDLYDFFEYSDDQVMLAFGDSSGKGAAAALYGALFSGLLRSLAPSKQNPSALLRSLNEALMERQVPARYVTLLLMLWQAANRTFTVANAGSTPPLICRGGQIIEPKAEGVPVGLLDDIEYDETRIEAQLGDVVFLFSDGVQDQQNDRGEDYGRTRLRVCIAEIYRLPAQEIADRLADDVARFRGSVPLHDDQTVVVLKVK